MRKFENVNFVDCKKKKCNIHHNNIESEVEVEGVILEGKSVIKNSHTRVRINNGICKIYNDILVCRDEVIR